MLQQLFPLVTAAGAATLLCHSLLRNSRTQHVKRKQQIELPVIVDENFVERVRTSCQNLSCDSIVRVDDEKVREFVKHLNLAEVRKRGGALASEGGPCDFSHLTFETVAQEAGFITLLHAVDFGSGYRQELHRACEGRGAWLCVKAGMSAVFRADPSLSASFLANISDVQVAEFFQLPLEHEGKPSGLSSLICFFGICIREVGKFLQTHSIANMGDFVIGTLHQYPRETRASSFVRALVAYFPLTFDDAYVFSVNSQNVYLYKKAQLVVGELYHRFRSEDALFDFGDGPSLTAFVDNVICATLRQKGIIECSPELNRMIDQGEPLPRGSIWEVALRAKALAGIEAVVEGTNHAITSVELGNYLWGYLGKEPACRSYPRHATKDTCFY